MPESLNTFEIRLLDRLQEVAADRAPSPAPTPTPAPRRHRRVAWGGVAAAGAAALVASLAGIGATAKPAWAVDTHRDGTVSVTVNRPEGAEALERRLADVGIVADVEFPPHGMKCAPRRAVEAREADSRTVQFARLGSDKVELSVVPAHFVPGTTLVLEVSIIDHIDGTRSNGMVSKLLTVRGTPPPCRPVPLTVDDFGPPPEE